MKILLAALLVLVVSKATSQTTNSATEMAEKIAGRMKDTLGLTLMQKTQLYDVNLLIHANKLAKRQQYQGSDSLRLQVQRVENTRDSLYRAILTQEQYALYLQKKINLINNNQ